MYSPMKWIGITQPCRESDEVLQFLMQYNKPDQGVLAVKLCCPWDWGTPEYDKGVWVRSKSDPHDYDAEVLISDTLVIYDSKRQMSVTLPWSTIRRSYLKSLRSRKIQCSAHS